ncbi:MAG: flagellar biosynthetic protein FliR [Lachnospiraceae bacterium]|nr:flagellar biosynthetic protein FliR [Lachnospiraceae bacterium]
MIDYSFSIYDLEYFLLILVRVTGFIYIAPFFSQQGVPNRVKVGLGIFTAGLLYQTLAPADAVIYNSTLEYALIVIKETCTGLILGLGANMCMSVVQFAGTIADMETGLSMVTLFDPSSRQQMSITGAIYNYAFIMTLIATGMYRYLFGALADSFILIPVNGAIFNWDALVSSVVRFFTDYVLIGFRIILPIFCAMILLNAILGIMAKVSPQMNMFAVGVQLKVIIGLSILFLSIGLLEKMTGLLFDEIQELTASFVSAMGGQ